MVQCRWVNELQKLSRYGIGLYRICGADALSRMGRQTTTADEDRTIQPLFTHTPAACVLRINVRVLLWDTLFVSIDNRGSCACNVPVIAERGRGWAADASTPGHQNRDASSDRLFLRLLSGARDTKA